jgi:uncharacterized membrane protein
MAALNINKITFFAVFFFVIVLTTTTNNNNNMNCCNAFQQLISYPSLLSTNKFQRRSSTAGVISDTSTTSSKTMSTSMTSTTRPTSLLFATTNPTPIIIETNDELKDPKTLISSKDNQTQQLVFISICIGILGGSFIFIELYNYLEIILPTWAFNPFYYVLPYILSSAFIAAGISHFVLEDTFTSFVPPKGAWGGLFIIPAPFSKQLNLTYKQYHSFWTGIAEIIVGTSLIVTTSGVLGGENHYYNLNNPTIPSLFMYILTLIVTPANIYMYTHNPVVPRIPPLPYPYGHIGRGILQMALLGVFYKLTIHSYYSVY